MRVITYKELKPQKGIEYSQDHLRRMEKAKQFPQSITLGAGRVAWIESEVDAWIESRAAERSNNTAA